MHWLARSPDARSEPQKRTLANILNVFDIPESGLLGERAARKPSYPLGPVFPLGTRSSKSVILDGQRSHGGKPPKNMGCR